MRLMRKLLFLFASAQNSDSSCDGFHVVQLPLADDCVDGSEIDKAPKFDDEGGLVSHRDLGVSSVDIGVQPWQRPLL